MYIEYVTVDERKVLHQIQAVEESTTSTEEFNSAVRRLRANGFEPKNRMIFGNLAWTDGKTDAYIHSGSLEDVRRTIIRNIHECSFLD